MCLFLCTPRYASGNFQNSGICVPIKEHNCTGIVQLVHLCSLGQDQVQDTHGKRPHLVEIRNFCDVRKIDDGEVLDLLSDCVKCFVHNHALGVPVMSKANYHNSIFFGFDGFVYVPARRKVRQEIRHGRLFRVYTCECDV
jgi:hypothetical protein